MNPINGGFKRDALLIQAALALDGAHSQIPSELVITNTGQVTWNSSDFKVRKCNERLKGPQSKDRWK